MIGLPAAALPLLCVRRPRREAPVKLPSPVLHSSHQRASRPAAAADSQRSFRTAAHTAARLQPVGEPLSPCQRRATDPAEEIALLKEAGFGREDGVILTRGQWTFTRAADGGAVLHGRLSFSNVSRWDAIVLDVRGHARTLWDGPPAPAVRSVEVAQLLPNGTTARPDGYWEAVTLRSRARSEQAVGVTIFLDRATSLVAAVADSGALSQEEPAAGRLAACLLVVTYDVSSRKGLRTQQQHIVLPLPPPPLGDPRLPSDSTATGGFAVGVGSAPWAPQWVDRGGGVATAAVPTHLLTHLARNDPDDLVEVAARFAAAAGARPGDVIAIAETPLALTQGRYLHPANLRPSWLALVGCKLFDSAASCSSASCLQAVIHVVGLWRVALALCAAVLARALLRRRGVFYAVAGAQAALADDCAGTMPPFDRFVCLGPARAERVVAAICARTGVEAAVVDVNDRSREIGLTVVAASAGVDVPRLTAALLDNPAGNAAQQTPLVIVRGAAAGAMR